jgi:hypothetical protein
VLQVKAHPKANSQAVNPAKNGRLMTPGPVSDTLRFCFDGVSMWSTRYSTTGTSPIPDPGQSASMTRKQASASASPSNMAVSNTCG